MNKLKKSINIKPTNNYNDFKKILKNGTIASRVANLKLMKYNKHWWREIRKLM